MDSAKSAQYCLLSSDLNKYDPNGKQTEVTASQTSWYQQADGCLLLITPSKSLRESLDAPLRLHLMLRREGGLRGRRGGVRQAGDR